MTTTGLVVMEPGSEWPGQVGDSTRVVAFSADGEDLHRKTQAAIETIRRRKECMRVAVLACAAASVTAQRRVAIARTLLTAVSLATCGRLILTVSGHASREL